MNGQPGEDALRYPHLLVKTLHVSYGPIQALRGVTMSAKHGEFLGIIGPNGSGKSTLLRAIVRELRPHEGQILLDGRDIWLFDSRALARRVAVVPQNTAIAFDFTVLEVVLLGRTPHLGRLEMEGANDYQAAENALAVTDTAHLRDRPATQISGGELQRVMIAKALAQEPELLLLDEPTSHLDINHQLHIMDLVRELNDQRGLTVISVHHDLNLAAQYCDRLVVLKDGVVFSEGSPADVLTAETVEEAYGAEVEVGRHPVNGRPFVILTAGRAAGDL